MNIKRVHKNFSTYAGLLVWGASGFMAQPTIASGLYHLFVMPALIALTIFLAHHEREKNG